MLLASNWLVATFALFLFVSFAEISQGSGNQPRNGVGGNYVCLECYYAININMEIFYSVYFYVFSFHSFLFVFTTVMCLFTQEKISQVFVFLFLSTCVSDPLMLFSERKFVIKRAGWYDKPSFLFEIQPRL